MQDMVRVFGIPGPRHRLAVPKQTWYDVCLPKWIIDEVKKDMSD